MRRALVMLSLAALALCLAACAGGGEPDPSADDEYTLPPPSDPMASWQAKSPNPAGASIAGTLGFDDIEGGCAFIETADGTRYEVIYPAGWLVDRPSAELRGPAGEVVPVGGALAVHGSIATDRSSTCQIGPIFVATEVVTPT